MAARTDQDVAGQEEEKKEEKKKITGNPIN